MWHCRGQRTCCQRHRPDSSIAFHQSEFAIKETLFNLWRCICPSICCSSAWLWSCRCGKLPRASRTARSIQATSNKMILIWLNCYCSSSLKFSLILFLFSLMLLLFLFDYIFANSRHSMACDGILALVELVDTAWDFKRKSFIIFYMKIIIIFIK